MALLGGSLKMRVLPWRAASRSYAVHTLWATLSTSVQPRAREYSALSLCVKGAPAPASSCHASVIPKECKWSVVPKAM